MHIKIPEAAHPSWPCQNHINSSLKCFQISSYLMSYSNTVYQCVRSRWKWVNPSNSEATLVQSTRTHDFRKPSKPCHVGIHWIVLAEYSQIGSHVPGFQSIFSFFFHNFVLARLATSSISVNIGTSILIIFGFAYPTRMVLLSVKVIFKWLTFVISIWLTGPRGDMCLISPWVMRETATPCGEFINCGLPKRLIRALSTGSDLDW